MRLPAREPGDRRDEHDRPALGQAWQGGGGEQEVRPHVDREHGVPLLGRGASQPQPGADADVAHQSVEAAHGCLGALDDPGTGRRVGDVADEHVGDRPLGFDEGGREGGGVGIDVGARDDGTRPASRHRDRPSVAHGSIRIIGGPRPGADDEDLATSQRARSLAHPPGAQ